MDKVFSEGFMYDIADLLDFCKENKTDNVDLKFALKDCELNVNITFSIKGGPNERLREKRQRRA